MKSLATLIALIVACSIPARAAVLDFEGLTTSGAEDITTFNQGYGGLTWTTGSNWVLFNSSSFATPTFGSYGLVNNFGVNPAIASGTGFTFNSVEIVGWSFNAPAQVGVRAFDISNVLIGDTGLISINTSAYTTFSGGWAGVYQLEFYGGQYFAIDNLAINSGGRVPEGGMTLALLGFALASLAGLRRRLMR